MERQKATRDGMSPASYKGALKEEIARVREGPLLKGLRQVPHCPHPFSNGYDSRGNETFLPIIAALRARYPDRASRPRVLQLASGFGQLGRMLEREDMEPVLVDVSQKNIAWGKGHGTEGGVLADARELPVRDRSVDAVVSDHFICASYFLLTRADEEDIQDEVHRVLRPGGILILYNHHRKAATFGKQEPYLALDFKVLCHRRRYRLDEEKMTVCS